MKKWHFRRLRARPGHTPSRRMTLLPLDTGATNGCCCLLPQLSFQFRRKSLNNFSYLFTIRAYKCARLSAKPATQPPPIWQISPPISPLSMDGCHKLSCRKWKRSVIDTQSKDTREKIKWICNKINKNYILLTFKKKIMFRVAKTYILNILNYASMENCINIQFFIRAVIINQMPKKYKRMKLKIHKA